MSQHCQDPVTSEHFNMTNHFLTSADHSYSINNHHQLQTTSCYNRMSSTSQAMNNLFTSDIPEEFRHPPTESFGESLVEGVKRRLSLDEDVLIPSEAVNNISCSSVGESTNTTVSASDERIEELKETSSTVELTPKLVIRSDLLESNAPNICLEENLTTKTPTKSDSSSGLRLASISSLTQSRASTSSSSGSPGSSSSSLYKKIAPAPLPRVGIPKPNLNPFNVPLSSDNLFLISNSSVVPAVPTNSRLQEIPPNAALFPLHQAFYKQYNNHMNTQQQQKNVCLGPGPIKQSPAKRGYKRSDGVPLFEDPTLPPGWSRQVVMRKTGATAGGWDTYIRSSAQYGSKRFRSKLEIKRYFEQIGERVLRWEDFDFNPFGSKGQHDMIKQGMMMSETKQQVKTSNGGVEAIHHLQTGEHHQQQPLQAKSEDGVGQLEDNPDLSRFLDIELKEENVD